MNHWRKTQGTSLHLPSLNYSYTTCQLYHTDLGKTYDICKEILWILNTHTHTCMQHTHNYNPMFLKAVIEGSRWLVRRDNSAFTDKLGAMTHSNRHSHPSVTWSMISHWTSGYQPMRKMFHSPVGHSVIHTRLTLTTQPHFTYHLLSKCFSASSLTEKYSCDSVCSDGTLIYIVLTVYMGTIPLNNCLISGQTFRI